ncbi:phosphocarrier protein [Aquamicrobium lusatiense]|uniref:Phosphocarrier protein n=1 Tax=Aquamicrobium lusatiense TaxID=89772 RepID=A0A7W9VTI3_9HYPH|nr:HPr family phosphocarrier protein [Aquamicrobium lusatiense]MBB6010666.1 phosphocarrier protein [Aquamicrobium lusatiense]
MSIEADNMEELARDVKIVNQRGLHARASAKFVQMVSGFEAEIFVEKDGTRVGGTSIMGLMMLAASPGCSVRVIARGVDAGAALDALEELISNRFGEEC